MLPKVGKLIEKDLIKVWYSLDEFKKSRELYQEAIQKHTSPLKIEIAKYKGSKPNHRT